MIFYSFKDSSVATTSKSLQKQIRGKPLKRLNLSTINLIETPRQSSRIIQQNSRKDFQKDLAEFAALRHPNGEPSSTLISNVSSQELLWVRDGSDRSLPPLPTAIQPSSFQVYDEIEDGEIVESEVTEIVDLLQESFAAVKQSQQIIDISSPKPKGDLFYEERFPSTPGIVPKYKPFGADSSVNGTSDDEVICLDNSQETDDSVIFVSEEVAPKVPPLTTPDCLKSPSIDKLLNFSKARKVSPKRKMRMQLWKEKKAIEYAEINAAKGKVAKTIQPKPPVLESVKPLLPVKPLEPEKRIVLIDGSNLAMSFTDNYGAKKTDKDFSAEGKKRDLKIIHKH